MRIEIKRVCVPTDFSEASQHAIRYGSALAETYGAELHLLHVLRDFGEIVAHPDFTADGDTAKAYFNSLEQAAIAEGAPLPEEPAESETGEATQFLKDLEHGTHQKFAALEEPWWEKLTVLRAIRYGSAVEEICRYARKHSIDLLVLGTHGHTGLRHMLLGSVAERVVRVSPCPTLTVRHPAHDFVVDE